MARWRVLAPWLALAVVVAVAVTVVVVRSQPDGSDEARAARLARELKCPDCEGETVANSNTRIARDIRAGIRERIADGQGDGEILAYYESRYPNSRTTPAGDGIGVVAWGLPVLVIVGALGGLVLALQRWSRQPRLRASAEDERLVERARAGEAS
jgi:cytochrome c-type biogenesis protein CcmH